MRIIILFLFSIALIFCQPAAERCQNEELLLKPYGDSLPVFDLSAGMPALRNFLDSMLQVTYDESGRHSHFYLKDSLFTPCQLDPYEVMVFRNVSTRPANAVEILLNDHGQILIMGELVKIQDLDSLWKLNDENKWMDLTFSKRPKRVQPFIHFSENAPIDVLVKILSIIHNRQNHMIMEQLQMKNPIPFCELSGDSIQAYREMYPLNIYISWHQELISGPPIIPESLGL